MQKLTTNGRSDAIETNLDQPNRTLSRSAFFRHPSSFRARISFLAKNTNTTPSAIKMVN